MKQREHFFFCAKQKKNNDFIQPFSILENICWMQDDNSYNSDFFMKFWMIFMQLQLNFT